MKLEQVQSFEIDDAESKQFHRIVLLKSGSIVGLYSKSNNCYLHRFSENGTSGTKIEFTEYEVFEWPTLFHFNHYVGIYSSKNDFIVLYDENEKGQPIKIQIGNKLPEIQFPNFTKPLSNYKYAGNTDNNIIPVLFTDSGLLPVYFADLQLDIECRQANWLNLKYWGNKKQITPDSGAFERPQKPFAILHALHKRDMTYIFGIGNKDGGYLKPGMDFSDLVITDETGTVTKTLFSLGRLYKENTKGGKECIYSSSGKYAILTPVFKSDDWKNKQKLFDMETQELMDIELPKGFKAYRIIDHTGEYFLLADSYVNLIFADTKKLMLCKIQ